MRVFIQLPLQNLTRLLQVALKLTLHITYDPALLGNQTAGESIATTFPVGRQTPVVERALQLDELVVVALRGCRTWSATKGSSRLTMSPRDVA